jgi:hypothetical protein
MRSKQSGSVMRLRGRQLDTPVLWYRQAETGRILVLILNNHVGTQDYFTVMASRIAELEARGYAVYWEGIRKASEQEWAAATEDERAAQLVMASSWRTEPRTTAAALGWVFQKEGLPIGDRWVNADITDLEVIQATGPGALIAMGRAADEALARYGSHRGRFLAVMLPLSLRQLARPHARLSKAMAATAPEVFAVLVGQRSKLAAALVNPGRDAVLIYGAEHADSIEAGLAAAGWERTGTRRWLTVGQLPPFWKSVAQLVAVVFRAEQERRG